VSHSPPQRQKELAEVRRQELLREIRGNQWSAAENF
jgi:hypothetical protein